MIKLTPAQRKALAQLGPGSPVCAPYWDNFRTFDRVMTRLVGMGLAKTYVHGGYEITDLGRETLNRLDEARSRR